MTSTVSNNFQLEISLLQGEDTSCIYENLPVRIKEALEQFQSGNYGDVLLGNVGKNFFELTTEEDRLDAVIHTNLKKLFAESGDKAAAFDRQFEVLLVAASCLQLFIQNNWMGPRPSTVSPRDVLPQYLYLPDKEKHFQSFIEDELSVDGEPVYSLTLHLEYLYICRYLLLECRDLLKGLQTSQWWLLRCLCIQQQILDDKSNTLRETVKDLIENISKMEPLMTNDKCRDLQIQFHVEAGKLCHVYYMYKEAREHYNTARKLAAITIQLTGIMGKRTRFQQEDKAQLVLQVTREEDQSADPDLQVALPSSVMPKNLCLEDDTVLDAIKFTDDDAVPVVSTSATEQALILGIMEDYRRSRASTDKLTEEEIQAYLSFVLSQVKSWSVSVSALNLRSRVEKDSRRRVERSMMQLEELYNQTKRESPSAGQRLYLFHAVNLVPVWTLQKELAELLLSLGAVGSALEIYERLQMWESAIACYQRMGKVEKAETVIREQLAIKETANLWCFLGDVTRHIEHYERAWEMSNHRSARAQRCLGYLYFGKEQYEKCLECFEKSLKVNALQVPVWFTYGCAAMAAKDYKLAVRAFKRCVSIDYDNFEAWNNLASSYIKLKEKKKAHMTLNDALKCNYENWRIWDNYLVVSTDCGEFSDAIRAYHRLMDLKEKWVDEQVLQVLVRAVIEDIPDANQKPASSFKPSLKELFGRVTAKVTDKGEIWRLYAQLYQGTDGDQEKLVEPYICKFYMKNEDPDQTKDMQADLVLPCSPMDMCMFSLWQVLQFLQKAHRCVMQTSNWEKDLDKCQEVSKQAMQLADTYLDVSKSSEQTKAIQVLSSAKLMLRGVLTKIKQQHTDPISQQLAEGVKEACTSLESKMNTIIDNINALKGS